MHVCWLMQAAIGEIHAVLLHKQDERMLLPRQAPIREINPYTRFFPLIRQSAVYITENMQSIDEERFQDKVMAAGIIGRPPGLIKILDKVRRIANTTATILIRGESGTSKELIAQLIYSLSD